MRCRYHSNIPNDYFDHLEECEIVQEVWPTGTNASHNIRMVVRKADGREFNVYVGDFEVWDIVLSCWKRLLPVAAKRIWK